MKSSSLVLHISLLCGMVDSSLAAETFVPKHTWIGTESASREQFRATTSRAPEAFQGEYAGESGDGMTRVRVSVLAGTDRSKGWTVSAEFEERVAGQKALRKSIKAPLILKKGGFWAFESGKSRGVFASYRGEGKKDALAEPGLILDGVFLFQTKR